MGSRRYQSTQRATQLEMCWVISAWPEQVDCCRFFHCFSDEPYIPLGIWEGGLHGEKETCETTGWSNDGRSSSFVSYITDHIVSHPAFGFEEAACLKGLYFLVHTWRQEQSRQQWISAKTYLSIADPHIWPCGLTWEKILKSHFRPLLQRGHSVVQFEVSSI